MTTTEKLEERFGPHKGNPHVLEGFYRPDLYRLFHDLGLVNGVEIGIEKGKNAVVMFASHPTLKLHGVDSFIEHPQVSHFAAARKRNWDEAWFADVKKQCLTRMKDRNFVLWEGFSEDVVKQVPENYIDFVYLDSDHSYDFVMHDMIIWGRKLKKSGIISGHDYYSEGDKTGRRQKVKQAVDDYTSVHGIKFYVTGEKHGEKGGDYYPSWFWVRETDPNLNPTI